MTDLRHVAETIRAACIRAATKAYEDAGMSGLCGEGRWQCALQAIEALDLDVVLRDAGALNRGEQ